MIFAKTVSWLRKRLDPDQRPTDGQAAIIAGYYTKAMNLFHALQIDVDSKPAEKRRLYHMMMLYLDRDEAICPAASRTASLSGFLDSLNSGRIPAPENAEVPKPSAEEIDGHMAIEISRNHLGMKTIHDEIADAIAAFNAKHSS
jgi:hypothetical protein